jgi:hypothetical protein
MHRRMHVDAGRRVHRTWFLPAHGDGPTPPIGEVMECQDLVLLAPVPAPVAPANPSRIISAEHEASALAGCRRQGRSVAAGQALRPLRIVAQHWRSPSSTTSPLCSAAVYSSSSTSACSRAPAAIRRPSVQAAPLSAAFRPPGGIPRGCRSPSACTYASPRRRSLSVVRRTTFADGMRCSSSACLCSGGSAGNVDGSSSGPS